MHQLASRYLHKTLATLPAEALEGANTKVSEAIFGEESTTLKYIRFVETLNSVSQVADDLYCDSLGEFADRWQSQDAISGFELLVLDYQSFIESGMEAQVREVATEWLMRAIETRVNEKKGLRDHLGLEEHKAESLLTEIGRMFTHETHPTEISVDRELVELARNAGLFSSNRDERTFTELETPEKVNQIVGPIIWSWVNKYYAAYWMDESARIAIQIGNRSIANINDFEGLPHSAIKLGLLTCIVSDPLESEYAQYWFSKSSLTVGRLMRSLGRLAFVTAALRQLIRPVETLDSAVIQHFQKFFANLTQGEAEEDQLDVIFEQGLQMETDLFVRLANNLVSITEALDENAFWQAMYGIMDENADQIPDVEAICARWTETLTQSLIDGSPLQFI